MIADVGTSLDILILPLLVYDYEFIRMNRQSHRFDHFEGCKLYLCWEVLQLKTAQRLSHKMHQLQQ